METDKVIREIYALRAKGHRDILVSIDNHGHAVWGEVIALPRKVMEQAVKACGDSWDTEGMISDHRYLFLFEE